MKPRLLFVLAALSLLAGCGKPGAPHLTGSAFPHPYPNPDLAPTAPAKPVPEDQAALEKAKFTAKGSYIDPSVHATEMQRSTVSPGSTLPYTQQTGGSDGGNTPFSQTLGTPNQSPLPPVQEPPPAETPEQP